MQKVTKKANKIPDSSGNLEHIEQKLKNELLQNKVLEQQLRFYQTRYRRLLDTVQEGVMIVDSHDWEVIDVNSYLCELLGYSNEEFLGKKVWELAALKELEKNKTELIGLQNKGRLRHNDVSVYTKDGWRLNIEYVAWAYCIGQQKTIQFNILDVTERKRIQEALKESQQQYRAFAKDSKSIAFKGRMDFSPIFFYGAVDEITGFTEEDFISGRIRWDQLIHPEDMQMIIKEDSKKLRSIPGFSLEREYRIIRKDQDIRWVHEFIQNITDNFGKPVFLQGAINDITDRRLAVEELELAYQKLLDMIEFLPDATFVVDKDKKVIAWNRAIEEMTGLKKQDIVGKGDYAYAVPFYGKPRPILIDLVGMHDREIEEKYSYVQRIKETLVAEVFVPSVFGGKGAFLWIKASPLYDSEGNLVGAIESVRDITAIKEAEAILRKDKDSFERLVNERTEQLLRVQRELVDSKHLSEIGALAATIAHELRNPLAAIRTAAYNIGRKSLNPLLKNHLANIEKKVLESDQIINNLLSYARIKVPHFESVRVHLLLKECVLACRDRYRKWKVAVHQKCNCTGKNTIKADPLHLRELFNNILNNAYEAFPEKKGKVNIKADYNIKSNSFKIVFEDNGVGISHDSLRNIYQPFFTTKSKGTGLGLTICRQLVNLHDGKVEFHSEKGKGTSVTITLPIERKLE
jgi:PAS domain S-box-containing protein